MREIKFRAWHKTYDLLCDVVEIVFGDDDNYVAVENGEYIERWRFDDIELMQYTGLKDMNGVEIYEGDIVEVNIQEYVLGYYTETNYTSVVKYKNGSYYFDISKSKTIQTDINSYPLKDAINLEDVESDDCEVIGNKHQTPELLEEEL
ncbi:YopX family protein [Latilactobacillus sakei]|uniref:YopX family protein n=1 Tax=Latilactobacillus sakei TaxID=1599 RepID=UPI003887BF7D